MKKTKKDSEGAVFSNHRPATDDDERFFAMIAEDRVSFFWDGEGQVKVFGSTIDADRLEERLVRLIKLLADSPEICHLAGSCDCLEEEDDG